MLKRAFFVFGLALIWLTTQVSVVFACGGYPYFGIKNIPTMDFLVKAMVIETDDRGYNAIIRVENYYKGEGEMFLAVMRYKPALASGASLRHYDTGCLYDGYGGLWRKGTQGYFELQSNGDGTFTDKNGYGIANFYPVDGKLTYYEDTNGGYNIEFDEPKTISEEDFAVLMLEAGGREAPVVPIADESTRYPLMRFLNFTTTNDTRYQVNPDRSILQLPPNYPIAISPDGAHVALREDDKTIAFQYIWTEYPTEENLINNLIKVPGQAVEFSNDSNFAVVWDQSQLTIYMFTNQGSSVYGYGQGMEANAIARVELTQISDSALPKVLWSADSSTIAREDGSGVWRWDIHDDAVPQQLTTSEEDDRSSFPSLIDLSTYGRFVRIGQSDNWTLMDADTGDTYTNAIVSPTEQFMIYINGDPRMPSDERGCRPPLRETCIRYVEDYDRYSEGYEHDVQAVFAHRMNRFGWSACDGTNCTIYAGSWHPSFIDPYQRYFSDPITGLRQITYDPQYDQPALLVGDYTIYFGFYSDPPLRDPNGPIPDILPLEDEIDSPIESIKWGQPVFYDEYNVMTTEYLPR